MQNFIQKLSKSSSINERNITLKNEIKGDWHRLIDILIKKTIILREIKYLYYFPSQPIYTSFLFGLYVSVC